MRILLSELTAAGSPRCRSPLFLVTLLSLGAGGCLSEGAGDVGFPLPWSAADAPVSSGFGPRLKASEAYRYDFHRGIDLPTPVGTRVVAVAPGTVRIAGLHEGYSDQVVQVGHGWRCNAQPEACWFSTYVHLSEVLVQEGDVVRMGQTLALSGASESGFEHLHFEIRDGGFWQQNAVNPAPWIGYRDDGAPTLKATAAGEDVQVVVQVTAAELDVAEVRIDVLDAAGGTLRAIDWDPETWNRSFTHTSDEWPAPDCAFAGVHPQGSDYDPNVHLDDEGFQGLQVNPAAFREGSGAWSVGLVAPGLLVDEGAASLRVSARDSWDNVTTSWTKGLSPR